MAEKLFLEERLNQIVSLVREQRRVSVTELSERFGVTPVTVRNDLKTLEQQGLLVRTHGGAMVDPMKGPEPAFTLRQKLHAVEKECIGLTAAELVQDGDTIAFDASTTAWQVARHVKDRRELTVITNGLYIALEFLHLPGVTVVMPGGTLRGASASLVGDIGADYLGRYHVQKGFFGARGLTLEEGLTDVNQYEVALKRRMVAISREVIAVVDASKWGQVALASFASLGQVDKVIADTAAPAEMVAVMRDRGIEVILV